MDSDGLRPNLSPTFVAHPVSLTSPFRFFHPTHVDFHSHHPDASTLNLETVPNAHWSSRASRKNRYTSSRFYIARQGETSGTPTIEQRIRHAHTRLKPHLTWDISFWVAVAFVIGSTCWVVNGFYFFLPLVQPSIPQHITAASWWAFAGGTIFELGSYLMVVESLNTGHEEIFGLALLSSVSEKWGQVEATKEQQQDERSFRWIGWGSMRDLGFVSCFVQLCAATVFWISTITGIPGVIPSFPASPPIAITDVFFWSPQVVGGTGFIIASLGMMEEVQRSWWRPALRNVGWHIAVWNLVGSVGFTLCGALGYASLGSSKANYQSVLSTFWGSWAFLIGSVAQLWETVWREDPESPEATPVPSSFTHEDTREMKGEAEAR